MNLISGQFFSSMIKIIAFTSILYSTLAYSILQENCPKRQVPSKFAILTTTYIRKGGTHMFLQYLKRYAQSDCPLYDNIYIIWNNKQSPQSMDIFKNKDKWKKHVYILQTIQNSLDFKYIVPPWVPETVFFSMDDDFDIKCGALQKGFQKWKQYSYGQIGPLTSFYGRSFVFQPSSQSFTYIDQLKLNKKWNYYHFGLTGIAFISRHFLDLYYSDIYQIKQMRKQVVQKNNCQDLLLNFLIGYLYPEVINQYFQGEFISLGISGVSTTAKHKSARAQCITKFSDILGYNPMRYVQGKKENQIVMKNRYTNKNDDCIVNLKQDHFQTKFISDRAYYLYIKKITTFVEPQKSLINLTSQNQILTKAKSDIQSYSNKKKEQSSNLNYFKQTNQQLPQQQSENDIKIQEVNRKMLYQQQMSVHFGNREGILSTLEENHKLINQQNKIKNQLQDNKKPKYMQNNQGFEQNTKHENNKKLINDNKDIQQNAKLNGFNSIEKVETKIFTFELPPSIASYQKQIFYVIILLCFGIAWILLMRILNGRKNIKYETIKMELQSEY